MMKTTILAYHIEVICVRSVEDLDITAVLEEGVTRVYLHDLEFQGCSKTIGYI